MQIPPEIIDKIRQAADIVDIIGSYITLKKKGANYWGPCPFHSEKQPLLVSVRQSKFLNALVAAKVVMYLLSCKNMMVLVFRKLSGSSGKNIISKFLKMN